MYTKELLRKIQLTELDIFKEFDRVCREEKISYVIDAGTLLGAVRHSGFIPWDDDIDIRMLRKDYDRFCSIANNRLKDIYFLQTYKTDKNYRWGYARILNIQTEFVRKDHEEMKSKNGVFIDIFPCDSYPSELRDRRIARLVALICRKGRYSIIGKNHTKNIIKKIGFFLLSLVPVDVYHRMEEELIKHYRDDKSEYVRCYAWSEPAEERGFRREWFENRGEIMFEGVMCFAPLEKHNYLVHSFGEDYMTLPPESERFPRHEATKVLI